MMSSISCPKCNTESFAKIIDSRSRDGVRYRRYKCDQCGSRWSTAEILLDDWYKIKELNKII